MVGMPADGVEVKKTIVEMECENGTAVLIARSKAHDLPKAWRLRSKGVVLKGTKRHDLVSPSFSAADKPTFVGRCQ